MTPEPVAHYDKDNSADIGILFKTWDISPTTVNLMIPKVSGQDSILVVIVIIMRVAFCVGIGIFTAPRLLVAITK